MDSRILQEAALSYLAVYDEELREEMEDCGMILAEDYYPVYEDRDGYGKGVDTDPLAKLTPNTFLGWQARNPSRRPKPDTRIPKYLNPTTTSANVADIIDRRGNPKAKSLPQENPRKPKMVKVGGKWQKQMESFDFYDVVLHHLISEGYADTVDSAEVIMVNMSEDWILDIVEEVEQLDEISQGLVNAVVRKRQRQVNRGYDESDWSPSANLGRANMKSKKLNTSLSNRERRLGRPQPRVKNTF